MSSISSCQLAVGALDSMTVVSSRALGVEDTTTERSEGSDTVVSEVWKLTLTPTPMPMVLAPEPCCAVPPCVHDFVKRVASIPGVRYVVVEEAPNDAVHVTTFTAHLDDKVRNAIYDEEAKVFLENPILMFDFHLRNADEVGAPDPALIAGRHCFAIWDAVYTNEQP